MRRVFALVVANAALSNPAWSGVLEYDVSARTSVSARSPLPGDVGVGATGDVLVEPSATGTLRSHRSRFSLQYAPRLLVREPQLAARVIPLHQARATWEQSFDRATLNVREEAAFGVADVGSLILPAGSRPGGVFEVQTLGVVPFVRSFTSVQLDGRPSETVLTSLSVGYLVAGDPSGGQALPLQWGPTAQGTVAVSLSRRLALVTDASASHADFVTGGQQSIALATESLRWQWARQTMLSAGAGLAWTRQRVVELPGGPPPGLFFDVVPVAIASLTSRNEVAGKPVQLDLGVRLAPFADRFTGAVYERFESRAQLAVRFEEHLTASASGGIGWAVPMGRATQAGDRAVFADATLQWDPTRWFGLVGSGRVVSVDQPRLAIAAQTLWVFTVAAVVRDADTISF